MLKNLKKLFVCFLVLLFSSVSIVNISTVASFFDYPSDGDDYDYEDSSGEPLDLDAFFSESSDDFSEHSGLYEENYGNRQKPHWTGKLCALKFQNYQEKKFLMIVENNN